MTEDEVSDTIIAYLKAVDAEAALIDVAHVPLVRISRDHQNAARTPGAYALLTNTGMRDLREADHECWSTLTVDTGDGPAERIVESKVRALLYAMRVDVYASRATDYARLFNHALHATRASVDLAPMMVRRVEPIVASPQLVGSVWEGRAHFIFEVAALAIEKILSDSISSGSIDFEGSGGSTILGNTTFERTPT